MNERIRIGISSCLLGERVRYDGMHKLDLFIRDTLGPYMEFVPVCPEVECGMGVPREPVRLVGDLASPRLVTTRTGIDMTPRMQAWARGRIDALEKENLCGFIFKAKSPSSGMDRVKVYNEAGGIVGYGPGMFARLFMERFPLLPVEDEGRLNDPALRENFIERVFTLARYREVLAPRPAIASIMNFHARHKLLLMSHSPKLTTTMGRLLAGCGKKDVAAACRQYEALLLEALAIKATPARHANVLQHMAGYLREHLQPAERKELQEHIDNHRLGLTPLIVPVTLIGYLVRRHAVTYLSDQVYLYPHPLELKLRNHA